MLKFAADENFNNIILRGVWRHQPQLDVIRIQDTELAGSDDEVMLAWIASEDRILLTHDVNTVTGFAYDRVHLGLPMPGILQVDDSAPMSDLIEDILLIANASADNEWEGQVLYIPFK